MTLDLSSQRTGELAVQFQIAKPFPHIVIDDLWDPVTLDSIVDEFPAPGTRHWVGYGDPHEHGKLSAGSGAWGPVTWSWFRDMHSPDTANQLENLTGIRGLVADDVGGGMHMTGEGGHLDSHVDFNLHPENSNLERRVNFLVFLNRDWKADYGGTLILGEHRDVDVVPAFNRTVIFACSDESWHGHPEPVISGQWRKSLACYYYASRRMSTTGSPHSTLWLS